MELKPAPHVVEFNFVDPLTVPGLGVDVTNRMVPAFATDRGLHRRRCIRELCSHEQSAHDGCRFAASLLFMADDRAILDGALARARFVSPGWLAVDGADNLLVNDFGTLRQISNGVVTTLVATPLTVNSPLAVDADGALYTSAFLSQTIIRGRLAMPGDPQSHLVNASVLAHLRRGESIVVGFNVRGRPMPLLTRAIGPGLRPFAAGVGLASDPRVDFFDQAGVLAASNDNWDAALAVAFASVGAFPLATGSSDAALLRTAAGQNTVHVTSPTDGAALIEVFAAGSTDASGLINLSARHRLGSGAEATLTLGFTIAGPAAKTVLVRGIGPGLAAAPFNIAGASADPILTVSMAVATKSVAIMTGAPFRPAFP